jgi:hypothetical protein
MASFPRRPHRNTNWRHQGDALSALEVYLLDDLDFTIEVFMLATLEQSNVIVQHSALLLMATCVCISPA